MNEEYKEKLLKRLEHLNIASEEVEKIIDLLKDSDMLDYEARIKAAAFLEGYMTGLKEQIEWLNVLTYSLGTEYAEVYLKSTTTKTGVDLN